MTYKDNSKDIKARVNDLLKRMTLEEKVAQLQGTIPMVLISDNKIDKEKLKSVMPNGMGTIPQFPMPFIRSAKDVAVAYNTVQKYCIEETRLGIPVMPQVECLSGVTAADATSFPAPIGMASTFEPQLVHDATTIIGQQMRAITGGSNALAPVVDLARDGRWGRVSETFGECSYMNSVFGTSYVRGLQSDGDLTKGVHACAKHFLGYSYSQGGLNCAPIEIGQRELYEQFGRPFETMFHEADLTGVMCTYSEINGKPVSVSKEILRHLLRDDMGFQGSAVCDGGSIERTCSVQHTAKDMREAAVMALRAGLDGDTPMPMAYPELVDAVKDGELKEIEIDEAVMRVLKIKFELGLFDNPYVDENAISSVFHQKEHDEKSCEIAEKSITLLKNDNKLLPLSKDLRKVAVIGPHGNDVQSLFSGYTYGALLQAAIGGAFTMMGVNEAVEESGGMDEFANAMKQSQNDENFDANTFIEGVVKDMFRARSISEEIQSKLIDGSITYARGCNIDDEDTSMFAEAVKTAESSDVVVMTIGGKVGWGSSTSGEGQDRASLQLPGVQEELLKAIKQTGKPMVLVLFNGRPMTINWASKNVDSILEVWFTGPQGGKAIADILFGDKNPGGKLPVTVPRATGQIPMYYNHKRGAGYDRELEDDQNTGSLEHIFGGGYTDIENTPLYHFGYGLSYSEFDFIDYDLSCLKVDSEGELKVSAFVKNVSDRDGDEVVQFYIQDTEAKVTRPVKEMVGFKRITLKSGEMKKVTMTLKMSQLGFYDENMQFVVEPGKMKIMIGNSSKDLFFKDNFEIVGKKRNLKGKRSYISEVTQETVKEIVKTEH